MMKHVFYKALALAALSLACMAASAQIGVKVVLNGQPVVFGATQPQQVDGHVLVPLRGVLEQLGADVDWDNRSQTATATKGSLRVSLTIGSTEATVNGQPVTMDVPAQIIGGSTMIPLRFVSQALGAKVQWIDATQTVIITTGPDEGTPVPPPAAQGVAQIGSFNCDHNGPIGAGAILNFSLQGTPGAQVTFQIPGATGDIPMNEVQPGLYQGQWGAPRGEAIQVLNTSPIARMVVGNSQQVAQASAQLSIDTLPPVITPEYPAAQSWVGTNRPEIIAAVSDTGGIGIDPDSLRFSVDGTDVTPQVQFNGSSVAWAPNYPLPAGPHQVRVFVRDLAGNNAQAYWAFSIANHLERFRNFQFQPPAQFTVGGLINFSIDAEPGAIGTISIGNFRNGIPLREARPGHYEGAYRVNQGDYFDNAPVSVHFQTREHENIVLNAPGRLHSPYALQAPVILGPSPNSRVNGEGLSVWGAAAPFTRVHVHIGFDSPIMAGMSLHGGVGDWVVRADQSGHFHTPNANLAALIGPHVRLTITAVGLGGGGQGTRPSTVVVYRN